MTHSPRCAAVTWHQLPCIPSRMPRAPCSARPALAPVAHSCLGARPTRRRPIASSVCPPSKLTRRRLGALSHQRHGRPLPRSSSSGHTSSPSCCSRPRPRPSNTAAVTAMPLLRLVLLLTRAFLRGARQEGPLVPPTLPWQVELSEGPPPAPPLLRRRPHNKTHFPLHRLFRET